MCLNCHHHTCFWYKFYAISKSVENDFATEHANKTSPENGKGLQSKLANLPILEAVPTGTAKQRKSHVKRNIP